jgi:hypothetical protein
MKMSEETTTKFYPGGQLVVGLGTWGSYYVDRAKEITESVRFGGAISTEFIAIDSDAIHLNSLRHIERENKILVEKPLGEVIRRTAGDWAPEDDIRVVSTQTGFGRHRIGAPIILSSGGCNLNDVFNRMRTSFETKGVRNIRGIFIVCAGGGTGSGLLPYAIESFAAAMRAKGILPQIIVLAIMPSSADHAVEMANGYAFIKELDFIAKRSQEILPLVILLEHVVRGVDKKDVLADVIAGFLADLSFVPTEQTGGSAFDAGDIQAFIKQIINKNVFCIFGVNVVKFPFHELNWYYEVDKFIPLSREKVDKAESDLEKELNLLDALSSNCNRHSTELNELHEIRNKCASGMIGSFYGEKVEQIKKRLDALDEMLMNERRRVQELQNKIQRAIAKEEGLIDTTRGELARLEKLRDEMLRYLTSPSLSVEYNRIQLTREEVEKLRGLAPLSARDLSFRKLMQFLGREDQFFALTHSPISGSSIPFDVLANYQTRQVRLEEIPELRDAPPNIKELYENIIKVKDARVIVSTHPWNKDRQRLNLNKDVFNTVWNIERGMSALREVPIDDTSIARRFSFVIYLLMGGITMGVPDSKLPSSLPTVDALGGIYMERVRRGEAHSHHSFLFPTSPAKKFEEASKYILNWKEFENPRENARQIEKFWSDYSVMESNLAIIGSMIWFARFSRIVKDCIASQLASRIEELEAYNLLDIPESFDFRTISQVLSKVKFFANRIREINQLLLDALSRSNDLKKQTSELIGPLKGYWIKGEMISSDVKKMIVDLVNDCKAATANAMDVVLPKLIDLTERTQSTISKEYQSKYRVSVPELVKLPIGVAFQVQEVDRIINNIQLDLLPELSKNTKELINEINGLNGTFSDITQTLMDIGILAR